MVENDFPLSVFFSLFMLPTVLAITALHYGRLSSINVLALASHRAS